MGIPTEADFHNEEIGDILNRGLQGKNMEGYEKYSFSALHGI